LERQRKRRIEEIEEKMNDLEGKIEEQEQLLCLPEIFEDHEKVININDTIESLKDEVNELLEEWTELAELLDA
ncbi:MAG TPA: ABC transporter C-terminal domain-containing protein, partial [Bacillaceae bacterium]|nr:ABC transporter C-terminal domain-containing protein [Bacillaceae bacterium]